MTRLNDDNRSLGAKSACSSMASWSRLVRQAVRQHQPRHRGGLGDVADADRRHGPAPSRPPGGRSTRPTGPPTRRCASAASSSSTPPSTTSRRSSGPSWSPRSGARSSSPTARSSTRRWRTACLAGRDDRRVRVGAGPPGGHGLRHAELAQGRQGAGRRRGRHRSVELPVRGHHPEGRPGAGHRQHRDRKPAPDTPWNATRLGRLVAEKTDIPPGVFNVVTSSDHLVGEELVIDPRVDLISFTGSTAPAAASWRRARRP